MVAALVVASDGSAGVKNVTVALTSSGPSPRAVTISAGSTTQLLFVNTDSVAHSVVFAGGHCSFEIPPGEPTVGENPCEIASVHTYRYTVDGTFPGTVRVVGLPRSVSLTARAHTIKLGSRVKLQGRLAFDNMGAPFCASGNGGRVVLVLARHRPSDPFKRIAMFPARGRYSKTAVNNRCTYRWQREVRPGISTTYIAKTFGWNFVYKPARTKPFTVLVRP